MANIRAKLKKNYKAVGCPTCDVPPGAKCVKTKLPPGKRPGELHWRDMPTVAFHKARKDLYEKKFSVEFKASQEGGVTCPGKTDWLLPGGSDDPELEKPRKVECEPLSGTDRLNKLMGRT